MRAENGAGDDDEADAEVGHLGVGERGLAAPPLRRGVAGEDVPRDHAVARAIAEELALGIDGLVVGRRRSASPSPRPRPGRWRRAASSMKSMAQAGKLPAGRRAARGHSAPRAATARPSRSPSRCTGALQAFRTRSRQRANDRGDRALRSAMRSFSALQACAQSRGRDSGAVVSVMGISVQRDGEPLRAARQPRRARWGPGDEAATRRTWSVPRAAGPQWPHCGRLMHTALPRTAPTERRPGEETTWRTTICAACAWL